MSPGLTSTRRTVAGIGALSDPWCPLRRARVLGRASVSSYTPPSTKTHRGSPTAMAQAVDGSIGRDPHGSGSVSGRLKASCHRRRVSSCPRVLDDCDSILALVRRREQRDRATRHGGQRPQPAECRPRVACRAGDERSRGRDRRRAVAAKAAATSASAGTSVGGVAEARSKCSSMRPVCSCPSLNAGSSSSLMRNGTLVRVPRIG